jgi:predicted nucleic acid-binding protein
MAIQQGKLTVVGMKDEDLPSDIAVLPLDAGEKQVLCLALRDKADLVLFDDEKVREEAKVRGLNVKGTLGVIIQAYLGKLLELNDVQNIIKTIINREDIWISKELCRQVLLKLKTSNQN